MKKTLLLSTALLLSIAAVPAYAQAYQPTNNAPQENAAPEVDPVEKYIAYIQTEWARIKYQIPDEEAQLDAIHRLEDYAGRVSASFPTRAEPKIWEGITLSTDAGIVKGMSALGKVKKAKALFEAALHINPMALDGSAYTSLGSLYYQVPGWPIAFGDDDAAEENLKAALKINPNGIDPNFFYGDFLLQDNRLDDAEHYLTKALAAPARESRPMADAGRKQEIRARLAEIKEKQKAHARPKYN